MHVRAYPKQRIAPRGNHKHDRPAATGRATVYTAAMPATPRDNLLQRVRRALPQVALYGGLLAFAALLLQWLEMQFLVRRFSLEIYLLLLCALFTGVGAWLGSRLTARRAPAAFELDREALHRLGISEREHEVLALLAAGHSNDEIAARLYVSTNTVKTHLRNLYGKLGVGRRVQAVQQARTLRLVP